jgi:hypothetical protein
MISREAVVKHTEHPEETKYHQHHADYYDDVDDFLNRVRHGDVGVYQPQENSDYNEKYNE